MIDLMDMEEVFLIEHSMNKPSLAETSGTRKAQAEQRRIELLDAGLKVFSEKGFDAATLKDLSEEAGVAQGLIYHYFESKEDLLMAVVEHHGFVPDICRVMSPNHERPSTEVLHEQALEVYRLFGAKKELMRVFVREAFSNPKMFKLWVQHIRDGAKHLAEYLEARIAKGELRKHNTQVSARMIINSAVLSHMISEPPERLKDVVDCVLNGILNPTKPQKSKSKPKNKGARKT
jgi:AcrR family transcriptional regulator